MESLESIKERLREIRPKLQREYKVKDIGIFGSYSNKNYHQDSDIDIIVSFSGHIGWKFFDLKPYLEHVLNKKVDLVTKDSIKKRFRRQIMKEVTYI